MRRLKFIVLAAVAGSCFTVTVPKAEAQVSINIGVAPECPYGYYDAAPYGCAPPGYYGPEWFSEGVFVGAGPWFRRQALIQTSKGCLCTGCVHALSKVPDCVLVVLGGYLSCEGTADPT